MQKVLIPGTELSVSRFIFGTAALFGKGTPRQSERVRLLEAAYNSGFTHFDVAPYYGFGWSERDLSHILAAHPDVTVTTKVGMYSPGGEQQSQAAVLMRKACGRFLAPLSGPQIDWSVDRARRSLDGSLKRLGRPYIDLYLLHEPNFELINSDEWCRWLEQEVQAGRVRQFGIAAGSDSLESVTTPSRLSPVIQMIDSLDRRQADSLAAIGRPMQITYGYVSGYLSSTHAKGPVDVDAILDAALIRNPRGAIIVGTRKISRLNQYSRTTERFLTGECGQSSAAGV